MSYDIKSYPFGSRPEYELRWTASPPLSSYRSGKRQQWRDALRKAVRDAFKHRRSLPPGVVPVVQEMDRRRPRNG